MNGVMTSHMQLSKLLQGMLLSGSDVLLCTANVQSPAGSLALTGLQVLRLPDCCLAFMPHSCRCCWCGAH